MKGRIASLKGCDLKSRLSKVLPRRHFARSVSILAGGTAASQAVTLLAAPLLTRLYSPEDFGLLAVYASLTTLLGVIASCRYQAAIPLPKSDQEAANVLVLSLLIVLVMAAGSSVLVYFFRTRVATWLNTPALARILWLLPPSLMLFGTYQIFQNWAMRIKVFPAIAFTKLIQSVTMAVVQIGAFLLGPLALILGHISGQATATATLGTLAVRDRWPLLRTTRWQDMRCAALRYWRFPVFSTWAGLCNAGSVQLLPILIAAFFSAKVVGIYALTRKVLSLPMTFLGQAVGDVFYVEAAEAHRKNQLGELVTNVHQQLTSAAFPAAVLFLVSAPHVFTLVFGSAWREAGELARIMTPWLYLHLVTAPPTRIFPILDRHSSALVFQFSLLLSSVGAIMVGVFLCDSFIAAIIILSLINSLIYLSRLLYSFHLTGANPWSVFQHAWRQLAPAALVVAPFITAETLRDFFAGPAFVTWIGLLVSYGLLAKRLLGLSRKVYR